MTRCAAVFVVALCFSVGAWGRSLSKRDADLTQTYGSVFETIVADLISSEGDEVSIPDVSDTFGGFWLKGRFFASGGVLGNLSTLALESVSYVETGTSTEVNFEVTMDPMEASFSHFEVSTRFFSTEGSVAAEVVGNVIDIRVRIDSAGDDSCLAVLEYVKLGAYDDIEITSLNVGSRTEELFVGNMLDMAKSIYVDDIVSTAEKQLKQFLKPYILNVCDLLSS